MKTKAFCVSVALTIVLLSGVSDARRPDRTQTANADDVCSLPRETGPCRAAFPNFFFNARTGQCQQFTYGGCGGNANRFTTPGDCEQRCGIRPGAAAVRPVQPIAVPEAQPQVVLAGSAVQRSEEATVRPCPPFRRPCNKQCPNGLLLVNNCPVCACQPSTTVECPAIECPNVCPPGQRYASDADGCTTCNCQTRQRASRGPRSPSRRGPPRGGDSVECPTNICLKECPHGFIKDRFGCEVCVCARQARRKLSGAAGGAKCGGPQVGCTMYCPGGFVKGADGCDTCQCAEEGAAGKDGQRRGGRGGKHHGGRKHHHGNGTSGEGETPAHLPANVPGAPAQLPANIPASPAHLPANIPARGGTRNSPAHLPANKPARAVTRDSPAHLPAEADCSTVRNCRKHCPNGFLKDDFGCDMCACSTRQAPKRAGVTRCATCTMYCPHGYKPGVDGCNKCECNEPRAVQPIVPAHCADRGICRMHCENGFKAGKDGCAICECN